MIALIATGLASLILFAIAIRLLIRAETKPPVSIRTQSHRSPAEYDYRRLSASLRTRGYLCLLAGVASLVMCGAITLALSLNRLD